MMCVISDRDIVTPRAGGTVRWVLYGVAVKQGTGANGVIIDTLLSPTSILMKYRAEC